MVEDNKLVEVLTIDDCTFSAIRKPDIDNPNFINKKCDFVEIMFNNGTGCFDETGRETELLEIMTGAYEIMEEDMDTVVKRWTLTGGTDPFLWSFGHDLEIGFADIDDIPINFYVDGLNTFYNIIIEIHTQ